MIQSFSPLLSENISDMDNIVALFRELNVPQVYIGRVYDIFPYPKERNKVYNSLLQKYPDYLISVNKRESLQIIINVEHANK